MHQAFPGRFTVRRLSYEECLQGMRDTLALLRSAGKPEKHFLVTTSPVPMVRTFTHDDVLIANTYSKSLFERSPAASPTRTTMWTTSRATSP